MTMDYGTLKTIVAGQYGNTPGTLLFEPGPYNSPMMVALLSNVIRGAGNIVVTGCTVPPSNDDVHETITVSGQCANFYGQTPAALSLVFFVADGVAHVAIKMNLGLTFQFGEAFPILAGSVFSELTFVAAPSNPLWNATGPFWVFCSAPAFTDPTLPDGDFVNGQNFWGNIQLVSGGDTMASLSGLLSLALPATTAVGPVTVAVATATEPEIELALSVEKSLSALVPILKNGIEVSLISTFSPSQGALIGLQLSTLFDFGGNKSLTVSSVIQPAMQNIIYPGSTQCIYFRGDFTGILLPTPSQFAADFAALLGDNDLVSSLPQPYQSIPLELQSIGIGFQLSDAKLPKVTSVTVALGNADTPWDIDGFATLQNVVISGTCQNPFAGEDDGDPSQGRSWGFDIGGELIVPTSGNEVDLVAHASAHFAAEEPAEYAITAGLAANSALNVPMGDLLGKYLPSGLVPNFALGELSLIYIQRQPQRYYGFRAALDCTDPPAFTFGGTKAITINSGLFHVETGPTGAMQGGVSGGVDVLGVQMDFSYEMPGAFKISSSIPSFDIDVGGLVGDLVGGGWTAPSWFPTITFPQTDLFIQYDEGGPAAGYTFAIRAQPSWGSVVLQVVNRADTWAFAGGLSLTAPKISAFPGLSFLSGFDDLFDIQTLLFVFASADINGFQFPPGTSFGSAGGTDVALPTGVGLKEGFYFYGSMKLDPKAMKLAQQMFGLSPDLVFSLAVFLGADPAMNASLTATMSGVVTVNDKPLITIQGVIGAAMKNGIPQVFVEGVVSTDVSGTALASQAADTAAVAFVMAGDAAYLSASLIGSVTFGPITVADFVLLVGIDDAGIPSVGFSAEIDLSLYSVTYESSLSVFFDSGNPSNSLIAGSVSDLKLGDVFTTIVGVLTDGNDAPPQWLVDVANNISLTGIPLLTIPAAKGVAVAADLNNKSYAALSTDFAALQVSFSSSTTLIIGPDELGVAGVWYITDYPSSGSIKHYTCKQNADNSIGISLDPQFYYCMPAGGGSVTLGPPGHGITFNAGIALSGKLKIFMLEIDFDLDVRPNVGALIDVDVPNAIDIVDGCISLTDAGNTGKGPSFSLATFTVDGVSPHLDLSGMLKFLGLEVVAVVNIDSSGLLIALTESIGTDSLGADVVVNAHINGIDDFALGFTADVHIDDPDFELWSVDLGTLPVDIDMSVGMTFGANDGALFWSVDSVDFEFGGTGFTIPGFSLDVTAHTLEDLPGIILEAVKDLIWDFLKDAAHWLEWVGKGILTGIEDIGAVLDNVYNAIASVWGNERRVVVAVHESFADSSASTITITPSTPTAGVTQVMIDQATAWANTTLQSMVTNAVLQQIVSMPADDVGNFQVNTLQNIDADLNLSENQTWLLRPQGNLPTLTAMGISNPLKDPRFFTVATTAPVFVANVSIVGDFNATLRSVKVACTYNGVAMGLPYAFTSNAAHQFRAPWNADVGAKFSVQFTVTYQNSALPQAVSPTVVQRGDQVALLVPVPAAGPKR